MTFSFTRKPDYIGSRKQLKIKYSGAVIGSAGNTLDLHQEFSIVEHVTLTTIGTGTINETPTVTVSGGIIILYAVAAEGYLTVEGLP